MVHNHSRQTSKGRCIWNVYRLWSLAQDLPVQSVAIESIAEFDQNYWGNTTATCREVATHAKRIYEADLSHPIILSAEGHLMDGGHRLAKAWLLGEKNIQAVRFLVDPEPDELLPE